MGVNSLPKTSGVLGVYACTPTSGVFLTACIHLSDHK